MSNKNTKTLREEINKIEMEILNLTEKRAEILKTLAERAEKSESLKKASKDGKKILESREKKAFKLAEDIEFVKKMLVDNFNLIYKQGEGVSIENGKVDPLFNAKKNSLKALGFRWSPKYYRWYVPANQWGSVARKMRACL